MPYRLISALVALLVIGGCISGPKDKPEIGSLVGTYELSVESKNFLLKDKNYNSIPSSQVILRQNGNASVSALPDCYVNNFGDGSGLCLSGEGRWETETTDSGYGVTLTIGKVGSLKAGIYHGSSILIKHRAPPFALEFSIGDPD